MQNLSKRLEIRNLQSSVLEELRPIFQSRRFQIYCVGTAKSGTHSIAELFRDHYRAAHEPEDEQFIRLLVDVKHRVAETQSLVKRVRRNDRRHFLELNSSSFNYWLIDILLEEFPDAKFLLSIRDCYSWLDSFINHQLSRKCSAAWQQLRALRFESNDYKHAPEEKVLVEKGLYTLDAYLSYWSQHNQTVLTSIPTDKLLVIRTHEIPASVNRIATFLDIESSTISAQRSHAFKAKKKFNILDEIDPDFLDAKLEYHCKNLMTRFFPELKDAKSYRETQFLKRNS